MTAYEFKSSNHLAFLREQSAIAHGVGLAESTIDAQYFSQGNHVAETQIPYYLRGFKAIDKEIELIENRTSKSPYVPELVQLRIQKSKIIQNSNTDFSQRVFKNSPIMNEALFEAVQYDVSSTDIKYKTSSILLLLLSLFLGLLVGLLALSFMNVIRQPKN